MKSTPVRVPSKAADTRKERADFSKICCDRFLEVCKARIAIGTFLALTVVTLTGFGLQNKRFELFLVAAYIPVGLLLVIDTLLKSRYGAPFLYIGLVTEYELYGAESAAMLYLRFTPKKRAEFIQSITNNDRAAGYAAFRRRYAYRGMKTKLAFISLLTIGELALAYAYYP